MTLVDNRAAKLAGWQLQAIARSHSLEWLFCFLFVGCALQGCAERTTPKHLGGPTMGTTWSVTYVSENVAKSDADTLQQGITEVLAVVNASMSTYIVDSEISLFNASNDDEWFVPSEGFFTVLETALAVGGLSQGAYDVTVGPLVDLWGFGAAGAVNKLPPQKDIARVLLRTGANKLEVQRASKSVRKLADVSLDFSSLAKGYAVDEVAAYLRANGITRFLVEVGGEMQLAGSSPRGDHWRIAIEQPASDERSAAVALALSDVGIATSGDYRNYFEVDGQRYSHAIDPRTGFPVRHDLVSVTVVHATTIEADAWATALMVLGGDAAMSLAQEQGLAVYFIREVEGEYVHSHTTAFSPYLAEGL